MTSFASARNCRRPASPRKPNRKLLAKLKFTFSNPGPYSMSLPELPNVYGVGGEKAPVSYHSAIVGLARAPFDARFGRHAPESAPLKLAVPITGVKGRPV